jgi:hypothetical protein
VAHLAKGTFWLECAQLVEYVKMVYDDCTETELYTDPSQYYMYIPRFLEWLHRNHSKRDVVFQELGVLKTFKAHIKANGGKQLKKVAEITGVDHKGGA